MRLLVRIFMISLIDLSLNFSFFNIDGNIIKGIESNAFFIWIVSINKGLLKRMAFSMVRIVFKMLYSVLFSGVNALWSSEIILLGIYILRRRWLIRSQNSLNRASCREMGL